MAYKNNTSRDYSQRPQRDDNRPVKKHSGARFYPEREGHKAFISAWKYSKAGMLVITANFWKDAPSEKYEWECWVVNVTNRNTGQKSTHTALYNPKKGTLRISELNWVINPSAPNGGYCGMAFSKEFKAGRR